MKITKIFVTLMILTSLFMVSTISAEENNKETKVEVYVLTDENLTAFFNGTSTNGDVSYFIDGIEVQNEFMSIWNLLNKLSSKISNNRGLANLAYTIADNAYGHANQNEEKLNQHNSTLNNHAHTLAFHYDAINDTYNKLYVLRDEVVSFENHYLAFENQTNNTLNAQEDQITSLKAEINDLNGLITLLTYSGIGLVILGVGIYLFNRKYPIGNMFKNKKPVISKSKQYKILDYTEKPKRTLRYIITHIRRNKEKSPLKFLFSFFIIKK